MKIAKNGRDFQRIDVRESVCVDVRVGVCVCVYGFHLSITCFFVDGTLSAVRSKELNASQTVDLVITDDLLNTSSTSRRFFFLCCLSFTFHFFVSLRRRPGRRFPQALPVRYSSSDRLLDPLFTFNHREHRVTTTSSSSFRDVT